LGPPFVFRAGLGFNISILLLPTHHPYLYPYYSIIHPFTPSSLSWTHHEVRKKRKKEAAEEDQRINYNQWDPCTSMRNHGIVGYGAEERTIDSN